MVGMLGLEPRNPEGADLQSAAVAAVPHPHTVFKPPSGAVAPRSGRDITRLRKYCQQKWRSRPPSHFLHFSPGATKAGRQPSRHVAPLRQIMEPTIGIEPTTACLQDRGSTIELRWHAFADKPRSCMVAESRRFGYLPNSALSAASVLGSRRSSTVRRPWLRSATSTSRSASSASIS